MKKLTEFNARIKADQIKQQLQDQMDERQNIVDMRNNLHENLSKTLMNDLEAIVRGEMSHEKLKKMTNRIRVLSSDLMLMFPDQVQTDMIVANLDRLSANQNQDGDGYTLMDLPFHTRDRAWLVNYTDKMVNRFRGTEPVAADEIQDIVDTPVFERACRDFEQRLVKGYIRLYVNQRLTPDAFGKTASSKPDGYQGMWEYDKHFRDDVIAAVRALGIDQFTAEKGLETNAHLWREATMTKTFDEFYYPADQKPTDPVAARRFANLHDAHLGVWLQNREYAYYQNHKDIIDTLGLATDNMNITPRKAQALQHLDEHYDLSRQKMLNGYVQIQDTGRTL